MGIGVSVFLLAVGAILAFAVHTAVNGISLPVVGYILMAAGAVGLLTTLILFGNSRRRGAAVYDDAAPVAGRTTTVTRDY